VPFGEQASVIVSPSLPFSESAFASHGVGLPGSLEDGVFADGVDGAVSEWLPPAVPLSFLSFEQPAVTIAIAITKNTTQRLMFDRSNFLFSYERITTPSFLYQLTSGAFWPRKYTSELAEI